MKPLEGLGINQKNILNGKYKELIDELVLTVVTINSWLLSLSIVSVITIFELISLVMTRILAVITCFLSTE